MSVKQLKLHRFDVTVFDLGSWNPNTGRVEQVCKIHKMLFQNQRNRVAAKRVFYTGRKKCPWKIFWILGIGHIISLLILI